MLAVIIGTVFLLFFAYFTYSFAYKRGFKNGYERGQAKFGVCPSKELARSLIAGIGIKDVPSLRVVGVKDLGHVCQYDLVILDERITIYITKDSRYLMVNVFPIIK